MRRLLRPAAVHGGGGAGARPLDLAGWVAAVDAAGEVPHRVAMRHGYLLAFVIFAASCGGSAEATPTRAEFIRQGDAVCAQAQQELRPVLARAQSGGDVGVLMGIWEDQVKIHKQFVADMKAIGTPSGDEVARKLIASLEYGLELADDVQDALDDGDAAAIATALPAYLNLTATLNSRLVTYGFRRCGATA